MQNSPSTINLLLRRVAAFFYDCLLLVAIFFVITGIAIPFNQGQAIQHWSFKLFLVPIAFIFFDGFWRHGGQTLGMRAWRIKLEGIENEQVSFAQSAQRYFTGLLLFGICYLYMFVNPAGLALHDKLSKTRIVKHIS